MKTQKKTLQFAKLEIKLGYSEAYMSLGNPAHRIMTFVLFKLRWSDMSPRSNKSKWVCTNKDSFQLPYADLKKRPCKLVSSSITRGIDELLAKGFIKITEQGGSAKGHASIYGLSEAYLQWKPGDEPISVRRPFAKRGFCAKSK